MSKRDAPDVETSTPQHIAEAHELIAVVKKLDDKKLAKTLGVSDEIAQLNRRRFNQWSIKKHGTGKPALYAYAGDVYNGLAAFDMSKQEVAYAQNHLRILSGLYGSLKPLDAIMPYRLEMSTRLKGEWGKNLYEFWGELLAKEIEDLADGFILNCASEEYFKVVRKHLSSDVRVITPRFLHDSGNGPKAKMVFAKYMRGVMARWAIENNISNPDAVKTMDYEGYEYRIDLSEQDEPTFLAPKDFTLLGRFTKF